MGPRESGPNGVSIDSAVFTQFTHMTNTQIDIIIDHDIRQDMRIGIASVHLPLFAVVTMRTNHNSNCRPKFFNQLNQSKVFDR